MRNLKNYKKILVTMLMFASLQTLWSLPGVTQYIPDSSGEYVYYEDKSFKTETVVGFLYFNDSTYAARIYSPANAKAKTLEKDITVYVNVDPSKAGFVLTGEKIDGTVEGNSDLVNYLHDMLYELSKRRQREVLEGGNSLTVSDEFNQFGGPVKIKYNPLVPIFNIEEICGADGNPILQLQTTGLLADSSDSSFIDFKGLYGIPKDKKRVFKKDKKSEDVEVKGGCQSIILDSQWQQSMQNLWLLGDYALLSINEMPVPSEIGSEKAFDILARRFSNSTTHSYSIRQQAKITRDEKRLSVMNVYYQPESGNVTRDYKILTKSSGGNFAMLTFTVFDSVYQKSRFYFDTILKSYSVE